MKYTLKIEGMMCPHCEGRVRDALSALNCVIKCEVSHKTGEAICEVSSADCASVLTSTVEGAGYKVLGIE